MADKTKIFGIGVSGLVGSRITELLSNNYTIDNFSLETGVDITDPFTLDVITQDEDHDIVLLLAAKADVDGCEKDMALGTTGAAYKINVEGAQNVVNACRLKTKKIIYVSTDFVFDGENTPVSGYSEEDVPRPLNWYAKTKYKAEEIVKSSGLPFVIMRLAYPYQQNDFVLKKDFVHAIIERLKNNQPVAAVTDHIMTPTFLDDFAVCIDTLIKNNATGIFHTVGSQSLTPYDAAMLIANKFGLNQSLITKTTRAEYFKDRALRPFNLSMNNDKIKKLGVSPKTFEEGLQVFIK